MSTCPRQSSLLTSDQQDRERLERIAKGHRESFELMYIDYHRRLSRFLLRLSDDYALTEEVINDTMLVVWDEAINFRGASRVSTWVMSIAYRKAVSTLRSIDRRKNRERKAAVGESLATGAGNESMANQQWLKRALEKLSVEQRMSIELTYYLGYSCAEIAEICDCPVNTVKSRLHAARKRLRKVLPDLADAGLADEEVHHAVE